MNATPLLGRIADALARSGLEAILIGNAAAALHGSPVTTLDFDFMFRSTPRNLAKLRRFARLLGATVFRPYYPVSNLFRVVDDEHGLQVDFLATVHGVRSLESLRGRSVEISIAGSPLRVASLADIIKSKRAAARPRDLAVLPILEATLDERNKTEPAGEPRRPPTRKRS